MNYPTKKQMSSMALVGFAFQAGGFLKDYLRFPTPSAEVSNALDWNFWGAVLPDDVLQVVVVLILGGELVGFIGFLLFQGWARFLLAGSFVAAALLNALMGLYVVRGESLALMNLGWLIFMVPLVLSFFPPCSNFYTGSRALSDQLNDDENDL
ncbi:MAG: hypothetical protein ACQKBY_13530 [Verrucomicrobiales bacterium]